MPVAAEGWEEGRPLPPPDPMLRLENGPVHHAELPVQLGGRVYGHLRYGLSTAVFARTQSRLLRESVMIALAEIVLSVVLLAALGYWLTRHLERLTRGAERLAEGDLDVRLPVLTQDEIGRLTSTFNGMAANLRADIEALRQGNEQQQHFLSRARQEHARLDALLAAMNAGILFISPDDLVVYANPAFMRLWCIEGTAAALAGQPLDVVLASSPALPRREALQTQLGAGAAAGGGEIETRDGRVITRQLYPVRDLDAGLVDRLAVFEDITQQRQNARQLVFLAERDALTGLFNRHRFQEELARMLAEADRGQRPCALLFFDLDEFKLINDSFGHRAGDAILIRVAGEVGALVRRNETFSRLGGDEFAILMPFSGQAEAEALAARVLRAIAQIEIEYEGHALRLTSSLGIACYPEHAASAEQLTACADAAMYQAKQAGKNAWRVYRPGQESARAVIQQLGWNEHIEHALEHGDFELHYQGVYHAGSGALSHLEALVRMRDKGGRWRMPGDFIPAAEKGGKITRIDRWVIGAAIARLADTSPQLSLAINLSGRSIDDPALPGVISGQLAERGVDPDRLLVELTETTAVSDLREAQRFIGALRAAGCRVALDDVGAGFASFAYLKHIPADLLKIDGMFIRELPQDRDNQLIVRAIVGVAHGMGRQCVAEFVESADCLTMLRDLGVDLVQGYHLDMPRADHPALLAQARAPARLSAAGAP